MDLVDLSGYRLGIEATGDGEPPVVFVMALGWNHAQWDRVRAELAVPTTTVLYDRPGLGDSDPLPPALAARPRAPGWAAEQLNTLLGKADVPAPRVFVGHSIGGLIVERYVSAFPADTAGIVLLDTTDPAMLKGNGDRNGLLLDSEDDGDDGIAFGVAAIKAEAADSSPPEPSPPCLVISRSLGSWRLVDPKYFEPMSLREVDDRWQDYQRRLAARYNGDLILPHFSSHLVPADAPELVAWAVDAMVTAVRQRQRVELDPDAIYNAGGRVVWSGRA